MCGGRVEGTRVGEEAKAGQCRGAGGASGVRVGRGEVGGSGGGDGRLVWPVCDAWRTLASCMGRGEVGGGG